MITLLAIDPGLNACGCAYFIDNILVNSGLIGYTAPTWEAIPKRAAMTADAVFTEFGIPERLVIEWPQVYRLGGRAGADPNDLLGLAAVAGALCVRACDPVVNTYKPAEWKGQVPKEVHHARILRFLSDTEKKAIPKLAKSKLHNVLDAIGLGLFHLGRTGKGGTTP